MAKLNKHSSDQFTVSRPAFSMNGRMYKTLSLKATTTNVWQIKVKAFTLKSWRWSDQGDLMSLSWCLGHFAGRIWVPLRCDGSLLIIKYSSKWFYNETFSLLWQKSFLGWVCPFFSKGACQVIEWLDECTKDVNHILWFSSADHQRNVRQHSPPPTHKNIKSGNIFFGNVILSLQ